MIKIFNIHLLFLLFIFLINLLISINFNYKIIHPLILITILILLIIISLYNLRLYYNNHWFSYLIFLIIIGGIIIIFLYFIRFINNIKTSIKWKYLKTIPIKFILLLILSIIIIYSLNSNNWFLKFNEILPIYENFKINKFNNLIIIYLYPKNYTTLISIIYILLSLTIIVKICLSKNLTLRKIKYEKILI